VDALDALGCESGTMHCGHELGSYGAARASQSHVDLGMGPVVLLLNPDTVD
ncbi:uncharacterized protein METZ01_LOCUS53682, partial [marine metagenome]